MAKARETKRMTTLWANLLRWMSSLLRTTLLLMGAGRQGRASASNSEVPCVARKTIAIMGSRVVGVTRRRVLTWTWPPWRSRRDAAWTMSLDVRLDAKGKREEGEVADARIYEHSVECAEGGGRRLILSRSEDPPSVLWLRRPRPPLCVALAIEDEPSDVPRDITAAVATYAHSFGDAGAPSVAELVPALLALGALSNAAEAVARRTPETSWRLLVLRSDLSEERLGPSDTFRM